MKLVSKLILGVVGLSLAAATATLIAGRENPRKDALFTEIDLGDRKNTISFSGDFGRHSEDCFQVILTNNSRQTYDFYGDGSSWGDPTLTFDVELPNGKHVKVHNEIAGYTKNGPWTVRVKPGGTWVRNVRFNLPMWNGLREIAARAPGHSCKVSIRADIDQLPEKPWHKNLNLWVGHLQSPPVQVSLVASDR